MKLNIDVKVNTAKLAKEFEALKDDNVMYEIHDLFADMCYPYVPMYEGVLFQSVQVFKDSIYYPGPYAHYQYMGELYLAPNGSAWAKKNEKKYPSGIPLKYNTEKHEKASKEWDKAMMNEKGDVFLNAVKDILMQKFKELYG